MKYAAIKTGGKQYLVEPGDTLEIEKVDGGKDDKVAFDKVLLKVDDGKVEIGKPFLGGAKITAEILGQIKAKKVRGVKYQRVGQRTKFGHRQKLTKVRISNI
ncbi:MAG: 50S ribosomal protein L21 [Candidatus Cloacimonetes bacterium]|nr:50S ribosomal protein L21 [Candidatus Cloacimonadota bacterium]